MKSAEDRRHAHALPRAAGQRRDVSSGELDRIYDKRFPNPITSEAVQSHSATGNEPRRAARAVHRLGVRPVRLGRSLVGRRARRDIPKALIAPLAYHAHIPGPGSDGGAWRRRAPSVLPGQRRADVQRQRRARPGSAAARARTRRRNVRPTTSPPSTRRCRRNPRRLLDVQAEPIRFEDQRDGQGDRLTFQALDNLRAPPRARRASPDVYRRKRHPASCDGRARRRRQTKNPALPLRGSSDATVRLHLRSHATSAADVEASVSPTRSRAAARRRSERRYSTRLSRRRPARSATIDPDTLVVVAFVQDALEKRPPGRPRRT